MNTPNWCALSIEDAARAVYELADEYDGIYVFNSRPLPVAPGETRSRTDVQREACALLVGAGCAEWLTGRLAPGVHLIGPLPAQI